MPAQEKKPDTHPLLEQPKSHTGPDPAHANPADNPILRWLFSGGLSGLTEGVPFLQGLMQKSDGMTSQLRSAGVGWQGGPKVALESSRKIEGDENHAMDMAVRMGYADGNVSVERATGGKMLADDGAKLADSRSTQLSAGKDGAKLQRHSESERKLGDDVSKRSSDYSVGYGPKGPSGGIDHKTETYDGYTRHKQNAGASYGEKGLQIQAGSSRHTKIDDDHQMGQSTSAGYQDGRATFEHSKESRIKDEDLTGVVNADKTRTQVGFGKGGVAIDRAHTQTTEVGGETFTDETKHGYKDGKVSRSKTKSRTFKDDEGNEHTHSSGTSVSAGKDSANVGYTNEKKTKDGGSSASAVSAGVDWEKGEATVGASHTSTNKDGRSVSAGANATVDADGNLTAGSVNAGLSDKKSGTSVSVNGKYSVEAGKPEAQNGAWVVSWTRTVSGGASAGKKGGRGGVSVKGELSHQDLGTRVFHSKEEAEHFAAHAASLIPTDQPDPSTVAGALALEVGESRGSTDGKKGGVTLSGSAGIAGASAGADKAASHGTMIERVSPNLFQVTLSSADTHGLSGQFGIGDYTAGGYTQDGSSQSVTVQFDLSTEAGRKSFEDFNRTHSTPKKGGKVISQTEAEEHRHGTRLSYGAAGSASFNSSTWDSTTYDQSGKTEVHGGAYDQSIISNIPFMKGHDNMSISLAGVEKNDKERSYVLQGAVDSTDGELSRHNLSQITGMRYDSAQDPSHGKIKSSGKWRVDVNFTAAMADEFMKDIESEKVRDISIFESRPDVRNNLRKELKAAKTSDDRMKAIARFVGEGGFQGEALDVMRQQLFGQAHSGLDNHFLGNFDYDLMLPGDKNFRGVQGRLELEHKLAGYQSLMSGGEASSAPLVGSLQGELDALRRQRAEIADPKRYTDLPDELRAQQVQKLDAYIETVRGMRQSAALAATKLHPGQSIDPNEGAALDQDVASAAAGKGDPRLAELRKMRHLISSSDAQIDLFQFQYQTAGSELGQLVHNRESLDRVNAHKRQYDQLAAGSSAARGMQAIAEAQLRATEDLRVRFILSMNKPEEALAVGTALLAQLQVSESLLEKAADQYQRERDFMAGESELQEERPVYATLKTDAGTRYFETREEWEAYQRSSHSRPAAPR